MRRAELLVTGALLAGLAACSGGDDPPAATGPGSSEQAAGTTSSTSTTSGPTTTTSSTTAATSTTSTSSTSTSSTSTTSAPPAAAATTTTTTTSTVAGGPVAMAPADATGFPLDTEVEIGRSVLGRPITVVRRGTPGGTRVLVIGVIHGNEDAGVAIVDRLRNEPVPDGVELWLVRSMNPDGQAIEDRQNANLVDLNRNFPENWDVLGVPGEWQYGGPAPASEPETQAIVALGAAVLPDLILWYHQDLFRIAPGSGRPGEIRTRYAQLTGLPIVDITGGTYTGTASQWSRTVIRPDGVGITVELGPTLSDAEVDAHTAAVLTVAQEFW